MLEIYDLLYRDDEPLPNPDLNSLSSVIKFSPLSLWIHFNRKSDNKTFNTPDTLRNHATLLDEIIQNQYYQEKKDMTQDFALAICLNACK